MYVLFFVLEKSLRFGLLGGCVGLKKLRKSRCSLNQNLIDANRDCGKTGFNRAGLPMDQRGGVKINYSGRYRVCGYDKNDGIRHGAGELRFRECDESKRGLREGKVVHPHAKPHR